MAAKSVNDNANVFSKCEKCISSPQTISKEVVVIETKAFEMFSKSLSDLEANVSAKITTYIEKEIQSLRTEMFNIIESKLYAKAWELEAHAFGNASHTASHGR